MPTTSRAALAAAVVLTSLTLGASAAHAETRTFEHPQQDSSGVPSQQTARVVVRNTPRAVTVVAHGSYVWRDISSIDLGLQARNGLTCYDVRSLTPHRAGAQRVAVFGAECGGLARTACPGARITASPSEDTITFRVPQSCIGDLPRIGGSVQFEDAAGDVDVPRFGLVRQG